MAQQVQRIDANGNALELANGSRLACDYLVITTGPKLSFDEVPGAGPDGHSQSICKVDHAEKAWAQYQQFLQDPGPAVIGAMPGASCFGPAYDFSFIFNTYSKRRKLRHEVPITYVSRCGNAAPAQHAGRWPAPAAQRSSHDRRCCKTKPSQKSPRGGA